MGVRRERTRNGVVVGVKSVLIKFYLRPVFCRDDNKGRLTEVSVRNTVEERKQESPETVTEGIDYYKRSTTSWRGGGFFKSSIQR